MDRPLGLRDVKDVHPEVHDSLKKLLAYEGNVEEMGLFFQVCTATDTPALYTTQASSLNRQAGFVLNSFSYGCCSLEQTA